MLEFVGVVWVCGSDFLTVVMLVVLEAVCGVPTVDEAVLFGVGVGVMVGVLVFFVFDVGYG